MVAPSENPDDAVIPPPTPRDSLRVITMWILGILTVVVIALVASLLTFVGSMRATVDCLQGGYAELNQSYGAARSSAQQDRAAQRELLLSTEGRTEAISRFLARLDEADQARAAAPPPIRSCT